MELNSLDISMAIQYLDIDIDDVDKDDIGILLLLCPSKVLSVPKF